MFPSMKRTEPYIPLRLLVPVLADEVGGVYDNPEAFLIQQQHHFPLRAERGTSSVSSTLKHLSSANATGKKLLHHPNFKIYSLHVFYTLSKSAEVTGGSGWRGRWGVGMGKTRKPKAVSFQCMTKFTRKNKKQTAQSAGWLK